MGVVLVVEDDHAICNLMREALDDAGYGVHCANCDREACGRLSTPPAPAGLVVDVNLGEGTTGYDVARFARQLLPNVAVVYVSGEVAQTSFKAFGVPNSTFLARPFTPGELVTAVKATLRASNQ